MSLIQQAQLSELKQRYAELEARVEKLEALIHSANDKLERKRITLNRDERNGTANNR